MRLGQAACHGHGHDGLAVLQPQLGPIVVEVLNSVQYRSITASAKYSRL